jgi:hypothetical protein
LGISCDTRPERSTPHGYAVRGGGLLGPRYQRGRAFRSVQFEGLRRNLFPLCAWECSNDEALRTVWTLRALVTADLRVVPVYPDPSYANSGRRVGQAWLRKRKRTRALWVPTATHTDTAGDLVLSPPDPEAILSKVALSTQSCGRRTLLRSFAALCVGRPWRSGAGVIALVAAHGNSTARVISWRCSSRPTGYSVRQGERRLRLAVPFDSTAGTTQDATRSNRAQPSARESAYLSGFCNLGQRVATDVVGLWLQRSRVRAPSVILLHSA